MEQKMSFSKLVFGESIIQGCQMVEFKGQIPIFSCLIINLHFCFANLATLSNDNYVYLDKKEKNK